MEIRESLLYFHNLRKPFDDPEAIKSEYLQAEIEEIHSPP